LLSHCQHPAKQPISRHPLMSPQVLTAQSKLPNALVPVAITSDYYAQPKVLVVHARNDSGKDISGYTIVIRHKNPDGTVEEGRTETTSDMLAVLINRELAKDPAASESVRMQNSANESFPAGTGIFVAGENREMTLTGINGGSEPDIIAGVVFYTDGSFDEQDKDSFKRLLASRQSQLQQMKEQNELIRNALADTSNDNPVAAVLTEVNKRRVEAMGKPGNGFFLMDTSSNLQQMQRPQLYGNQKGKTERERLTQYLNEQERRVELMTPHCHLEIATSQEK
jgi:hypothetical protein